MRTGRQSVWGARLHGCEERKSLPARRFRLGSPARHAAPWLVSLANWVVNLARDKVARGEPAGVVAVNGVGAGVCGPLSLATPGGGDAPFSPGLCPGVAPELGWRIVRCARNPPAEPGAEK
jgi:hypothetical protein